MITLRSRDQLVSDLQAFILGLDPEINVSKDCDAGIRIQMLADALIGLQCNAVSIESDLFPDTASTAALEKHAAARLGDNPRKAATTTDEIEEALAVAGTVGAEVPAGTALVHLDGTRYQVTVAATIGELGAVGCNLQSITTGTIANKAVLEVLSFESPPTGIDATAQLAKEMTGAVDEETDAELLARLLDVMRNPPGGGRFSAYRQWAMAVEKVSTAYVYGPSSESAQGRRGLGVVDVAILGPGTGTDRIPSAATQLAVTDHIEDLRPAAMREFSVMLPGTQSVAFDVRIEPAPGYEWDWETGGTTYTVSVWDPFTKKLTWSASLPASVGQGDRLLVYGQVAIVASMGSDYTILDRVITGGGSVVGKTIYPAGAVSQPVLDAICAHVDELGPARGTSPDPEQTGWEDTLKLSKLYKVLLGVEGVDDAVIVAPAANVTPVDHAPSGVPDLLIAGVITVRPS